MALVPKLPSLVNLPAYSRDKETNTKNVIFPKCNDAKNKKINYTINEPTRPYINLKQLEFLLDKNNNKDENLDYHDFFMRNYKKIFEREVPKHLSIEPAKQVIQAIKYKDTEEAAKSENQNLDCARNNHDIRYHIKKLGHTKEMHVNPEERKIDLLPDLRKLLNKFPFERNEIENREIFSILYLFQEFRDLFPPGTTEKLMERFCAYASLETTPLANTPVFGHFAFYLILKGKVKTMSAPHLNSNETRLRPVTPEPAFGGITLDVGKCFGTINELLNRKITTKMFRVMTLEDECEFVKLSVESYKKITKKLCDEENMEKFMAIRKCKAYSEWPKHAIEELVRIFEWRSFAPNTILASEGYRCPFIGFTVDGVCHVLRKVDIKVYNKKKKEDEKKMKQVVVGKINVNQSFGEKSVTMNEQMSCTVVTETACRLGVIPCDAISVLDNITVRLLLQTDNGTFATLSQEDLQKKFIEQEKKKEWKEFKNSVVSDVIGKYNIVQGIGKHADC